MKKRDVLVLSNMYPGNTSQTFGIFVKNQVEALKARGLNIDIAVISDPRMGKAYVLKKYLRWAFKIMKTFLLDGRSYTVIHAHYVFPTGLFALLFKKIYHTRMIVTAHGGDIDRMAKKNKVIRTLTLKILKQADEIIVVGEQLKKDIQNQFKIDENKISIINMGVNREVFHPLDKKTAKEQLSLSPSTPIILYAGNIIKEKGLDELLSAFKEVKLTIPDAKLYLIGNPKKEEYLNHLKERIKNEQINDVYFRDAAPQSVVALWMSAADAFVLPSYMEGFGLVALEAMSCHTAVIGSNVGGLTHLLSNESGILVEPQNVPSLVNGLIKVLENSELRYQLIENGEIRAQANDQSRMIDEVLSLYFPMKVKQNEK